MDPSFVELAQTCAPTAVIETLAAVVSVESGFNPFVIRINTGLPLKTQPANKAEAVEVATALITEGHDLDLGLGGVNSGRMRETGLTVGQAFEPCANLKVTATLLQSYYRAAINRGANNGEAQRLMLVAYYGNGDAETGSIAGFDKLVAAEAKRLAPRLPSIKITARIRTLPAREFLGAPTPDTPADTDRSPATDRVAVAKPAPPPPWDVFATARHSPVLVFSNRGNR